MPLDLVVAAYDENVSFIEPVMARLANSMLHLYCKGPLRDARCHRIRNYDSEHYAFLYHIVHRYDSLAPVTIFTMGSVLKSEWQSLL